MNKTKDVARIFGRGDATKNLITPKNNKKKVATFFGFSYRLFAPLILNFMIIWNSNFLFMKNLLRRLLSFSHLH